MPVLVLAAVVLDATGSVLGRLLTLIEGAYVRAPILVLALSAVLVLPAVALISAAIEAVRRYRSRRAALRVAVRSVQAGGLGADIADITELPPRSQAWLTVEGGGATTALSGQVIRIGRHEDNDIRLADRSVNRHHAVIERTPDEAFLIRDVSGKDGYGVRVNGQRTQQAQLADGDVIELGRARLRFENVLSDF
jgi:hypothetical protein